MKTIKSLNLRKHTRTSLYNDSTYCLKIELNTRYIDCVYKEITFLVKGFKCNIIATELYLHNKLASRITRDLELEDFKTFKTIGEYYYDF